MKRVVVQDFLATEPLRDAVLVGGAAGLGAPVTDIALVEPDDVLSAPIPANSGVVFAVTSGKGPPRRQHLIDVLLRRTHICRARVLFVWDGGGEMASATCRLADRFSLPLIRVPDDVTPLELATTLRTTTLSPQIAQSATLLELNRLLRSANRSLPGMLRVIGRVLDAEVAACTAQGILLAGSLPATPVEEIVAVRAVTTLVTPVAATTAITVATATAPVTAAVLPVLGPSGTPTLWITAERDRVGPQWRETAERALALAHGELSAWLTRERIQAERDARLRSTLLTEILDHGDALPGHIAEQATMAGWQLTGWHTGIHIAVAGAAGAPAPPAETLVDAIARAGLDIGPLVQRTDGWSTWLTNPKAPLPAHTHAIVKALETGLAALGARLPGQALVAGIGTPAPNVEGIAATLAEARQAAVAASAGDSGTVRRVEDLGASRLLLGWYTSRAFHDYARQLLAPLLDPAERNLFATLETYIDQSCSTGRTARALGIHRNTVSQRIARAERLLGMPLTHPDSRLALQLAARVLRVNPHEEEFRQV